MTAIEITYDPKYKLFEAFAEGQRVIAFSDVDSGLNRLQSALELLKILSDKAIKQ